jgi:hypothetical protein
MPSSIRALFWDDDKDHSHSSSFLLRTNNGYVNEETRHLLQHTGDVSLQYNNDNVEEGLDRCANDPVVEVFMWYNIPLCVSLQVENAFRIHIRMKNLEYILLERNSVFLFRTSCGFVVV